MKYEYRNKTRKKNMKKLLICLIISISLAGGNMTYAHGGGWHGGGGGWHGGGGGRHHNGDDWAGAALGIAALGIMANQYYGGGYYNSYPYQGGGYYRYYRYRPVQCRWVRGHYDYYGYWIPSHRVCWR